MLWRSSVGTGCIRQRRNGRPYLLATLRDAKGPMIAASDYMKSVPDMLSPWLPSRLVALGTDGFGRSDNREHLRQHFEVNAESIVGATLSKLARDGKFDAKAAQSAMAELGLNVEGAGAVQSLERFWIEWKKGFLLEPSLFGQRLLVRIGWDEMEGLVEQNGTA